MRGSTRQSRHPRDVAAPMRRTGRAHVPREGTAQEREQDACTPPVSTDQKRACGKRQGGTARGLQRRVSDRADLPVDNRDLWRLTGTGAGAATGMGLTSGACCRGCGGAGTGFHSRGENGLKGISVLIYTSSRPVNEPRRDRRGVIPPPPSASPGDGATEGTAWCRFMCFLQCTVVRKPCSQNGHL